MIRKVMVLAAAAGAALAVTVSASAVPCCITNGSFESGGGSLAGWTTGLSGGSAGVVGGGVSGGGSWHARVTAGSANTWQSISQSFVAPAGRVFGWAAFNDDESGSCSFNDQAQVVVDGAIVWSASSCVTGSTPWQQWSKQVSHAGTHNVTVRVANGGDSAFSSSVDADLNIWDARLSKLP
jgi:hypothetical protein